EFWYTNVPGTDVPSGTCGGGAYRELLVYIDGVLADAVLPFPVIYTGGINPLLWRPLTGILSFDIPPYEFDLTPFASWLLDGAAHNVTVQVWGNNPQGTWFLDPVLLLRHAEANQSISGGRIRKLPDSVPNVTEQVHKKSNTSSTWTLEFLAWVGFLGPFRLLGTGIFHQLLRYSVDAWQPQLRGA
ncbi:unnamed protein product, partial [Symbiodinium necroappetens]